MIFINRNTKNPEPERGCYWETFTINDKQIAFNKAKFFPGKVLKASELVHFKAGAVAKQVSSGKFMLQESARLA